MKNYTLIDVRSYILPDQYLPAVMTAGINNVKGILYLAEAWKTI